MKMCFGVILVAIIAGCLFGQRRTNAPCSEFWQLVFSNTSFYEPELGKLMNIAGVDTITILDTAGSMSELNCGRFNRISIDSNVLALGLEFDGCKMDGVSNKVLKYIKHDDLPINLLSFKPTIDDNRNSKFKCYFVVRHLKVSSRMIELQMDRLRTNDIVRLMYVKRGELWELDQSEFGKY